MHELRAAKKIYYRQNAWITTVLAILVFYSIQLHSNIFYSMCILKILTSQILVVRKADFLRNSSSIVL